MIAVLPLFVLPMMLARLAMASRGSFRYGAAVDITAGDEARWGHGALRSAAADAAVVSGRAGTAMESSPRETTTGSSSPGSVSRGVYLTVLRGRRQRANRWRGAAGGWRRSPSSSDAGPIR